MRIYEMKLIGIIFSLFLALTTSGCIFMMGSHAYHEDYSKAGERVQKILVNHSICKSMQRTIDCEYYYTGTALGGFDFDVYAITDPAILEEIKIAVASVFNENPRLSRVTLKAWKYPHHTKLLAHTIVIKQPEPPIMKIIFRR